MSTNFPTSLDTFVDPTPFNNLSDPAVLHSTQHANLNDSMLAVQTKVGSNGTGIIAEMAGPVTAIVNNKQSVYVIYNTSGSGFTFNLPASPGIDQIVIVIDGQCNAASFAITINGNGQNIICYGTATNSSVQINANGGSLSLAWDAINWVAYA